MKPYIKPVIVSEQVFEKSALQCDDYAYYDKECCPCYEDCIGTGKDSNACFWTWS